MTKFRKQAIIQSFQSIWLCCIDDKVVLVNEYLSSEVSIGFWIGGGGAGSSGSGKICPPWFEEG